MKNYEVEDVQEIRLDKFINEKDKELSRNMIQKMIEKRANFSKWESL